MSQKDAGSNHRCTSHLQPSDTSHLEADDDTHCVATFLTRTTRQISRSAVTSSSLLTEVIAAMHRAFVPARGVLGGIRGYTP